VEGDRETNQNERDRVQICCLYICTHIHIYIYMYICIYMSMDSITKSQLPQLFLLLSIHGRSLGTEEIWLNTITTAKFFNMFSQESPYISNTFFWESPKIKTGFHVSKWSPRHSNECPGKLDNSGNPNIVEVWSPRERIGFDSLLQKNMNIMNERVESSFRVPKCNFFQSMS